MDFSLLEKHDISHKMQSMQGLSLIKNSIYDVLFDGKKCTLNWIIVHLSHVFLVSEASYEASFELSATEATEKNISYEAPLTRKTRL